MFLRKLRRMKDGKEHIYWALVESRRVGTKVKQVVVSHLGELAPGQEQCYDSYARQLGLESSVQADMFAAQGCGPSAPVEIDPGKLRVERVRTFRDAWMGLVLWRMLGLEKFLGDHIAPGRENVPWSQMIAYQAIAAFCQARKSDLAVADDFGAHSALADLLGIDDSVINKDRLYRTLDVSMRIRGKLLEHLKGTYEVLFQADCQLLLYDLTSSYFEGQAEGNPMARRGYSRDGRPDAKQIVIAMVVTKEGLPLGCEVFQGNRTDVTTLKAIVRLMKLRHGSIGRIWVMDRGLASEDNLKWLRQQQATYLVGTPKSGLSKYEQQILKAQWFSVRDGVEVAFVKAPDGSEESFIVCKSRDRREKELSMATTFADRIEQGLKKLQAACTRKKQRLKSPLQLGKRLGVLLSTNSRARRLFDIEVIEHQGALELKWSRKPLDETSWDFRTAGHYLLRSNMSDQLTPEQMWKAYIQLTEVESMFRCLKTDMGIRPIYHHTKSRVRAHVFICFLALVLRRVLGLRLQQFGLGNSAGKLLNELSNWQSMDVILSTTNGQELRRPVIANPEPALNILLQRMGVRLPKYLSHTTRKLPTAT